MVLTEEVTLDIRDSFKKIPRFVKYIADAFDTFKELELRKVTEMDFSKLRAPLYEIDGIDKARVISDVRIMAYALFLIMNPEYELPILKSTMPVALKMFG